MNKYALGAMALLLASAVPAIKSEACTRIVYTGSDNLQIIGRSLDWRTPIPTNIYVYPAGMKKQGASDAKKGINWTSKYGAVYAVGYDGGITEGMNEKGLVVNGLFCKGTVYNRPVDADQPLISMAMFVAWLLDTCETTDEAVGLLKDHKFQIEGSTFDGGTVSTLHWGITDAAGVTRIIEFDQGEVKVYDPGDKLAMTNDPQWPAMNAIMDYWNKIGGRNMLPGTVSSPDRCVRANYFSHHVDKTADADLGAAIARSVLACSCVPYTYNVEGEPNLSSTQWCSFANTRDLRYYFDIVTNPGYYYVDLRKCNLKKGAKVMKLDTSTNTMLVGDATAALQPSAPFTPMY